MNVDRAKELIDQQLSLDLKLTSNDVDDLYSQLSEELPSDYITFLAQTESQGYFIQISKEVTPDYPIYPLIEWNESGDLYYNESLGSRHRRLVGSIAFEIDSIRYVVDLIKTYLN